MKPKKTNQEIAEDLTGESMEDMGLEDYCDEQEGVCESCGNHENDADQCPMCCDPGVYAPGSEECDWCGECSL